MVEIAKLDVEAAQKYLGLGKYQIRNLLLLILPLLACGVQNSNYVFIAGDVEYRCLIPECEQDYPQFMTGEWKTFALPSGEASRCFRYVRNDDASNTCSPEHFTNVTEPCSRWVYGSNHTIVSEFDMACKDWMRTLVGTMHSTGKLILVIFIGLLSDRFGRLPVLVATAVCPVFTALGRYFITSYGIYLVLECIDAMFGGGAFTTGFILIIESVSVDYRVLLGNLVAIAFSIGQIVLAGAAWALPQWHMLLLALYLPSGIFITYIFLLHESPRWLAVRNRTKEAADILLRAANVNGVNFPQELEQMLTEDNSNTENIETADEPQSMASIASQVVHSKLLICRLAMCGFWWITCAFAYHGMSINSVSLAGNKHLNFVLTSVVEIPGFLLSTLTMDRFGRRISLGVSLLLCGVALVPMPFLSRDSSGVLLTLTLVGKLWISMAFNCLYIYTSELFPTQARHTMFGFCYVIGRIGQILAPQAPLLVLVWQPLPYLIFGVMAVAAALLTLAAPETNHIPLPDTVEQAGQTNRVLKKR